MDIIIKNRIRSIITYLSIIIPKKVVWKFEVIGTGVSKKFSNISETICRYNFKSS